MAASRDAEAWAAWDRGAPRDSEVGDDVESPTIYTRYRDMFRHLVHEEFRHSLGGPNQNHGSGEVDEDINERSLKDITYLGMFCIDWNSVTRLEDAASATGEESM